MARVGPSKYTSTHICSAGTYCMHCVAVQKPRADKLEDNLDVRQLAARVSALCSDDSVHDVPRADSVCLRVKHASHRWNRMRRHTVMLCMFVRPTPTKHQVGVGVHPCCDICLCDSFTQPASQTMLSVMYKQLLCLTKICLPVQHNGTRSPVMRQDGVYIAI